MTETALGAALDRQTDRYYGKYRGLVVDNQDPMQRGRLKATVAEVLKDVPTPWATPCVPYAGTAAGLYAVPPPGAGVWIEFEAGDVSRPVWVGCWWAAGEAPLSETGAPPDPMRKLLRSDLGLIVSLDDSEQTVTLSDGAGSNLVTIKVVESTIEIRALARVVLEAPIIEHGDGASQAAVFGDQLLSYLNQLVTMSNGHTHPGQVAAGGLAVTPAPPLPALPQATPALLSVKNLVG
jgi:hypothetical protein